MTIYREGRQRLWRRLLTGKAIASDEYLRDRTVETVGITCW